MLKRNSNDVKIVNKQVFSDVLDEKIQHQKIQHFPLELIRHIALYLNDLNDIKCLMSLSKEIRSMIIGIPRVMKKIKINFSNDISCDEVINFLKISGIHVKNMNFEPKWGSLKCLKYILNFVPNLDELTVKFFDSDTEEADLIISVVEKTLALTRLEFLDVSDSTEPRKLRFLSIDVPEVDDEEMLTNLIVHQNYLEQLILNIQLMDAPIFLCRDISQEIKFKLKILKLSIPEIDQEIFINFLKTQASCLEELELNFIASIKIFEVIFKNFKTLKKFTIDEDASDVILDSNFPDLKLENLKYFHDKNQNGTIVSKLFARFPNIEILKCCDTMQATGTYSKLTTLEVSEVYWPRIRNLKLPNLKNLFIKKVDRCDDEYYWTNFTNNFLNVQNITVEKVGFVDKDVLRFVKRLKVFTKLRTFKLRHGNAIDHDYKLDENEIVEVNEKFYKILMDTTAKTIKLSSYIVRNCKPIKKILLKTFKGFEFFEFCFPEIKICRINIELKRC